jgi:hypothetical protein
LASAAPLHCQVKRLLEIPELEVLHRSVVCAVGYDRF